MPFSLFTMIRYDHCKQDEASFVAKHSNIHIIISCHRNDVCDDFQARKLAVHIITEYLHHCIALFITIDCDWTVQASR